jgi:hypothetical protein
MLGAFLVAGENHLTRRATVRRTLDRLMQPVLDDVCLFSAVTLGELARGLALRGDAYHVPSQTEALHRGDDERGDVERGDVERGDVERGDVELPPRQSVLGATWECVVVVVPGLSSDGTASQAKFVE